MVFDTTPASEPADAAAINCLLVKLFLAIFKPFHSEFSPNLTSI
jgi:hypothetical protein